MHKKRVPRPAADGVRGVPGAYTQSHRQQPVRGVDVAGEAQAEQRGRRQAAACPAGPAGEAVGGRQAGGLAALAAPEHPEVPVPVPRTAHPALDCPVCCRGLPPESVVDQQELPHKGRLALMSHLINHRCIMI